MRADAWRLGTGVLVLGALLAWLLGGGPAPEREREPEAAAMPEFAWPVQPLEPTTPTSTISGTVRNRDSVMLGRMRRLAALVVVLAITPSIHAAPAYTPKVGQSGKDVIWVPTPDALADRMLAMAQVRPEDQVVDLGSGDGRLVILAAKKYGARARGVEYNGELVALAQQAAKAAGVAERAQFEQADIFKVDFRAASVITLYMIPAVNRRLRPILLAMRPGTRVVSHQFAMEDWLPDETSYVEQRTAYLWIVPALVGGGWSLAMPDGAAVNLDIEQKFQQINGRAMLASGAVRAGLRDTRLRGDAIWFTLVDTRGLTHEFTGRVLAGRMEGKVTAAGVTRPWSATQRVTAQE